MGLNPIVSLSPYLLISLFLLFLGEGVENDTCYHSQETDEEGKVISPSRVGVTHPGVGINDFPQGWHEDRCSGHGEEIDPCHHSA